MTNKRIDEILHTLKEYADNPKKGIAEHLAKTGKGAVGVMPVYAPEELIHAAGYFPVGIWGGQTSIRKAGTYLPSFACSIMQSVMEFQLAGVYDDLAAVVMSVPCDTLKCMSQKWKGTSPVIQFTHPQNRKIEGANVFLTEEYRIVRSKLEDVLGITITDDALEKSIEVYNENRRAMRAFADAAAEHPEVIDPAWRHAVMKSRWFMEKSAHTALVKELTAELSALEKTPWTGKKVVLTGIMAEPYELLDIFKEFGVAVAADDLAQESRQFRVDVPEGTEEPLYRMAKMWQNFDGCALAGDTKKVRGQMLMDLLEKYQADAVVVCMMKFCDPEEFDYPIYYAQFEKADIPSLYLEIEQQSVTFEQQKTRVQSFIELL